MKYKLHYIDKLRENKLYSPLFFGNAFDEACSRMLLEKKKRLTKAEKKLMEKTPEELFIENFSFVDLNGTKISTVEDFRAIFFKADFDESILPEIPDNELEIVKTVQQLIINKHPISEENYRIYHTWVWNSLYRKGLMFIDLYRTEIFPQINEVFSVQKKWKILNEESDKLWGKIDFECDFVDEIGVKYEVDNKTSSQKYVFDAVEESEQLAIYNESTGNPKSAYIVIEKVLRKKQPRTRFQILRGKVSERTKEKVFTQIESVLEGVKQERFEKNWNSCFNYGKKCAYFDYCRSGSKEGLICVDKKPKK